MKTDNISKEVANKLTELTMKYAFKDVKSLVELARKETGDKDIKTRKEAMLRLMILDLAIELSDSDVVLPSADDDLDGEDLE